VDGYNRPSLGDVHPQFLGERFHREPFQSLAQGISFG
jgi:hypothetical protein